MNKKKIAYSSLIVVVLVLGYLNYFADEEKVSKSEEVVETVDAVYNQSGYHIEAGKQRDYIKIDKNRDDITTSKTTFEKAKAVFDGLVVTGDNGILNASKDLLLKNNIFGKSLSGWEINTEEIEYKKGTELIKSTVGVTATNKDKGIVISGRNFTSDTRLEDVNLMGDIKFTVKDITLEAEKAKYNDKKKIVDILGVARLNGNNIGDTKGEIKGEFQGISYDLNTNLLKTDHPFKISYNNIDLYGDHLVLNDKTEAFEITGDVYIKVDGYKINLTSITSDGGDEIFFNGKIEGTNGENSFSGDSGVYNKITKKFVVKGNLEGHDKKGGKLTTDYAVYSTETKELELYGSNKKDIVYVSPTEKAITKSLKYNTQTGDISLKDGYTYNSSIYDSKGEELYYNKESGDGKVKNGYIKNIKESQEASGKDIIFNQIKKNYIVQGDANFKDKLYTLKSEKIEYLGEKGFAYLPSKFEVVNNKNDKFIGKKAEYNIAKKLFTTFGEFEYYTKDNKLTGENLLYDQNTEIGKVEKNIKSINLKDGSEILSNKGEFKKDQYVKLMDKLKLKIKNTVIEANSGEYRLKDEKVYIPGEIILNDNIRKSNGKVVDGVYNVKTKMFFAKKFQGEDEKNNIKSDIIRYYVNEDKIQLEKNVVIKGENSVATGEKFDYYKEKELAKALVPFKVIYTDYTVTGDNGDVNLKTNYLDGKNIKIVSKLKEEFRGDYVQGSMKTMALDFKGNVKGRMYQENTPVDFQGDFVRGYFKKDKNGEYRVNRVEIRKNAVIKKEGSTLYSDYIEAQPEKKLIYAKDNTKGIMKDKGVITEVTADILQGNLNTEVIELIGDVRIERKDKNKIFKSFSEKGRIEKKIDTIYLIGNVKLEDNTSIITADEAEYNTKTRKIKLRGEYFVDYKANQTMKVGEGIKRVNEGYNNFIKK